MHPILATSGNNATLWQTSVAEAQYNYATHLNDANSKCFNSDDFYSGKVVQVKQKSLTYVIGERVLSPTIDAISSLVGKVFSLVQSIDQALTFPGVAYAKSIDKQQIANYNPVYRRGVQAWLTLGLNQESYSEYIEKFQPNQKLELMNSKEFHDSLLKLNRIMSDLSKFIVEEGLDYNINKKELVDRCTSLKFREIFFREAAERIKENKFDPCFSFPTKTPFYSIFSEKYMNQKDLCFNPPHDFVDLKTRKMVVVNINDYEEFYEICSDNPIQQALFLKLADEGALFETLNTNEGGYFNFDQFKQIFKMKTINKLKSHIVKLTSNLKSGVENVEDIVKKMMQEREKDILRKIKHHLNSICYKHQEMAIKEGYKFSPESKGALCTSWEITEPGIYRDNKIFSFYSFDGCKSKLLYQYMFRNEL